MNCLEYTTVNNGTSVFIPVANISHIIEHNDNNDQEGGTCWIQFLSGKSIHVTTSYEEVASDMDNFFKTHY